MNLFTWISSLFTPKVIPFPTRMKTPFIDIEGRITSYGYPADTTPDTNSRNAIGAWANHLVDGVSLAVSRDVEHEFRQAGIVPKDAIEIELAGGTVLSLHWDDRTAAQYNGHALTGRFDLYCKSAPSVLNDRRVIGFRRA